MRTSSSYVGRKLRAPNWPIRFETPCNAEFDVRGRISLLTENRRSFAVFGFRIDVHCTRPVWMRSSSVPLLLSALVVRVSAAPPTEVEFSADAVEKLTSVGGAAETLTTNALSNN